MFTIIKVLKTLHIAYTSEICMFWGNFIVTNPCLYVQHLFSFKYDMSILPGWYIYIYANTILVLFLSAEGFKQFSVLARELSTSLNDMVGS